METLALGSVAVFPTISVSRSTWTSRPSLSLRCYAQPSPLGTIQCGWSTAVYGNCGKREYGCCHGPRGRVQDRGNGGGSTRDSSWDHGEVDASTH